MLAVSKLSGRVSRRRATAAATHGPPHRRTGRLIITRLAQSSLIIARCAHSKNSRCTNHIASIPVEVSWIFPCFATIIGPFSICQSLSTLATPGEDEMIDKVLNEIVSAIKNDRTSIREISSSHISKLCKDGNRVMVVRLLQRLHKEQILLGANVYNLPLTMAAERNDIDLASQIFKDLLMSGICLSCSIYNNLARACTKTDDFVLLRFVEDVLDLAFPRSTTVMNRIIFAFYKCGQANKALLIYDHIKSLKFKPDLVTYNTVLAILGHAGRVDEMLHEFDSMKCADIVPDIFTYNTLINSLRNMGRLDLCLALYNDMGERGIEPDLLTYTALIENFGRAGNIEETVRLFSEMKQRCIRPSIYIYRSLINNLKKAGKLKLASEFSNEMNLSISNLVGPKDIKSKKR